MGADIFVFNPGGFAILQNRMYGQEKLKWTTATQVGLPTITKLINHLIRLFECLIELFFSKGRCQGKASGKSCNACVFRDFRDVKMSNFGLC